MSYDVTPRATYTWGPKAVHVHASEQRSHFQVFGRGARAYYNGRWDSVALRPVRKRALVVASTARASLKGHQ